MGQVWSGFQNTFKHHVTQDYLNHITDTEFDSILSAGDGNTDPIDATSAPIFQTETDFPSTSSKKKIVTYKQLHEAIVNVFKKINEIPGNDWVPPSNESVIETLEEIDHCEEFRKYGDKTTEIGHEEFRRLVRKFCKPIVATYAREMLIMTIAVPVAATLTKTATHRAPVVGSAISKVPNTVCYVSSAAAALLVRNRDYFFLAMVDLTKYLRSRL